LIPAEEAGGPFDERGNLLARRVPPWRLGDWSEQDIAEMLKTGNARHHGRVGSSMSEIVSNSAMLSDADRSAIVAYVKSLPAADSAAWSRFNVRRDRRRP